MSPTPELSAGAHVLVEGPAVREEGELVLADAIMLRLRNPRDGIEVDVPWSEARTISVRVGKTRYPRMPASYALVGAGLLGSCGWVLDGIDRSTSGYPNRSFALPAGVLLGGLLGWGFGKLQMVALGTAWWQPVYRVPDGVDIPEEQPPEERLAACAVSEDERASHAGAQSMKSGLAWVALLALLLIVAGFCH